jgi:hypothetical protein
MHLKARRHRNETRYDPLMENLTEREFGYSWRRLVAYRVRSRNPARRSTHGSVIQDAALWLSAVAQQERITLSERTKAGLHRAKRAGRKLGRKAVEVDLVKVERHRADGLGLRATAAKPGISVNTLQKARGKG